MFGGVDTEAPEARFGLSLDPKTSFKGSTWSIMGWKCPWLCPKKVVFVQSRCIFWPCYKGMLWDIIGNDATCYKQNFWIYAVDIQNNPKSDSFRTDEDRIQSAPPKSEVPTSPLRGQWSGQPATVGKWKKYVAEWVAEFLFHLHNQQDHTRATCRAFSYRYLWWCTWATYSMRFFYVPFKIRLILFDTVW